MDTSLQSLDLKSLREINKGKVGIAGNADLCYVSSINWSRLLTLQEAQSTSIMRNSASSLCGNILHSLYLNQFLIKYANKYTCKYIHASSQQSTQHITCCQCNVV